jgi:hypothetical protein
MLAIDKQAEKILMRTFWASGGWRPDPLWPTPTDQAISESAGYMFAPVELDHDAVVGEIRRLAATASLKVAAESFVASLSTRWKFLRSFLPSVVLGSQLPDHTFVPHSEPHSYMCASGTPVSASMQLRSSGSSTDGMHHRAVSSSRGARSTKIVMALPSRRRLGSACARRRRQRGGACTCRGAARLAPRHRRATASSPPRPRARRLPAPTAGSPGAR